MTRTALVTGGALLIGVAERMGLVIARHGALATGEAQHLAATLATKGYFGDSFVSGQGPSAHLMPVAPTLASLAYRALGVGPAASFLLSLWAVALVLGSFALLGVAAQRSGLRGAVAAFALLAVLPVYTAIEAVDFRVWEGALALTLVAALLNLILRFEGRQLSWPAIVGGALLAALLFFTHPTLGLAGYAMLALFAWRNLPSARIAGAALVAAVALALLVGPWALRNAHAMGEPILLRDNLGLELAVANYPGGVAPADPRTERERRLAAIHPLDNSPAYARLVAAGGEAAYSRALGTETKRWMAAHPADSVRLAVRHLRETLLPPPWIFETAHGVVLPWARSLLVCGVALLGLAGLWVERRNRQAHYWAILVAVPVLLYLPFQPVGRYCWLLYAPLAYPAAALVSRWKRA